MCKRKVEIAALGPLSKSKRAAYEADTLGSDLSTTVPSYLAVLDAKTAAKTKGLGKVARRDLNLVAIRTPALK